MKCIHSVPLLCKKQKHTHTYTHKTTFFWGGGKKRNTKRVN